MAYVDKLKENRKYKDSIFVDLLTSDEKNMISVCKALDSSINSEEVELINFENTVYSGLKNDVSCIIGNKLLFLIEHQSTINNNMPTRCIMYAGRAYEVILPIKNRYLKNKVPIPTPEFYVLYNGIEPYPQYSELRLSDLFIEKKEEPALELVVKVININYSPENEFLKKCKVLNEYAQLVHMVRFYKAKYGKDGYDMAIKWCLENNILGVYMKTRNINLRSSLVCEYDRELDIATQRKEAMEEGIQKGISQGVSQGLLQGKIEMARNFRDLGVPIEKIVEATGFTESKIKEL